MAEKRDEPITVFSCPPGNQATCEHAWDGPWKTLYRECPDCAGTGVVEHDAQGEPVKLCLSCDKGEVPCGGTATCSKCGMDSMTYSMWNGP